MRRFIGGMEPTTDMKQTVTVILNNPSSKIPHQIKVFAFDHSKGKNDYQDITKEVYDNVSLGTIQNALSGSNNVPAVKMVGDVISVHIKDDSLNAFYRYFRYFFHSCIPDQYVGEADIYLNAKEFEMETSILVRV